MEKIYEVYFSKTYRKLVKAKDEKDLMYKLTDDRPEVSGISGELDIEEDITYISLKYEVDNSFQD